MGKTAKQTRPSGRNGNVLPLGNHPGNTGGKKGRSGRPPGSFTDFLRKLRADPAVQAAVKEAATDHTSPGFRSAMKLMADYDTEKPAEKRDVAINGPVEVRVVVERESRKRTAG